jgi:pyruvate dehydrogenase E1 component alpha subunit
MSQGSDRLEIYRTMVRIRVFEMGLREIFQEIRRAAAAGGRGRLAAFEYGDPEIGPELQGNLELAVGQEPTAAGILHLRPEDYLAGSHRAHHIALAKGVSMRGLVAELFGKESGLCRGRAGDFTLHDVSVNFENSPIVGQLLPVATGHALAAKMSGGDEVAVVCIGDGAVNQGTFHEAANLAGLWRLPVVFLVENNGYAISTRVEQSSASLPLRQRASGYALHPVTVEGNDPLGVHSAVGEAVARARAGDGPGFVEVMTDRQAGAFEGDKQHYRPTGEVEALVERDPIDRFERLLEEEGLLSAIDAATARVEAREEFDDAVAHARAGDPPSPVEAYDNVFASRAGVMQ